MVPRGQSTFTCACQGHPECRVHPQGHARQPLSHWVIIQGLTDTSKHKEHLRKKCPQGQCVVAFHWWGVIPWAQDSLHLPVPISKIKLKRWMWNIHSWKNTAPTSEAVLGCHAPGTKSTHHSSLAGPQHADPQDEFGLTPSPLANTNTSFELPSFAPIEGC